MRINDRSSAAGSVTTPLTDSHWDREWAPIGLWFPVIGILSALLITTTLYAAYRLTHRH
ncbi:hypothetical protein GCM10009722_00490 [Williamsia deligens]|nr:hypothetical protein [Williamsia deligens]